MFELKCTVVFVLMSSSNSSINRVNAHVDGCRSRVCLHCDVNLFLQFVLILVIVSRYQNGYPLFSCLLKTYVIIILVLI